MTEPDPRTITRIDWLLIGVLVALVLMLRLWLLHNTEVTARDGIGYIRYALRFDKEPWQQVCTTNHQHPGYPVLIWLMSQPVRAMDGGATTPENMQLSAQLVSFVASLLLVLPMYFLGRQFFDRKISFGGTLLYQYLPISAQHLSDGISEPAYLVLLTASLLQGVHAVNERCIWRCALAGLFAGAAYVIRPEGLLVLPALAIVLVVLQFRADGRCSWKRFLACGTSTALGVMLSGSMYVFATGTISTKPSVNRIWSEMVRMLLNESAPEPPASIGGSHHLFAAAFLPSDERAILLGRSVWAFFTEISQGFHYIAVLAALLGFCSVFGALRRNPGFWLLLTYAAMFAFVLISLGMSVYYVSDRHVMILVIGGSYFVAIGLQNLAYRIQSWLPGPVESWWRSAPVGFAILFIGLLAICLPKTTQRLHGNRVANHAAGLWLATQREKGDMIEDDHSWSHYFSGLMFEEGDNPALPADAQPKCYVVTTKSRDPHLESMRRGANLAAHATPVWPIDADERVNARVVVYRQQRDFTRNPWRKESD